MTRSPAGVAINGDEVRRLRKLAGLSSAALAKKAQISAPYVSAIETGYRGRVSPPVFARICDALGIEDRAQLAREQLRPPRQRRRPAAERGEAEPVEAAA